MNDDLLPYGYEPHVVATLARRAAHKRSTLLIDYDERCDIASLAIIERLYLGDSEPGEGDLLDVGEHAISAAMSKAVAYYGAPNDAHHITGTRFALYWRGGHRNETPFEERLLERLALYEIYPMLSTRHREVIATVARHWGHRTAAAADLGITRNALMIRLSRARAEFRWYWYWPEHAPRHWGRDHGTITTHDSSGENRAIKAIKRRRKAAA